jgi:hypothetical protein
LIEPVASRDHGVPPGHRRFVLGVIGVTAVALLLREWFVLAAVVEAPIRGDIRDYVAYAWNLLHHGVFSLAPPASEAPAPDAYRGPGYPALLALAMWWAPRDDAWYHLALQAQAVLGALTSTIIIALCRHWLSRGVSLAAGALLAIWPHHIVATGALLSEVVFAFLLTTAAWLAARTIASPGAPRGNGLVTGVVLAITCLVNSLALPLAAITAVLVWCRARRREAVTIALLPILALASWQVRNQLSVAQVDGTRSRVLTNLVQGSWPLYHAASNDRRREPMAERMMQAIEVEERLIDDDLAAGLREIGGRIADDPGYYLHWYLVAKPFLLWDWGVRIGAGDVYFHRVSNSPLETNASLHAIKTLLERLNPLLFALAACFVFAMGAGVLLGRGQARGAALMVATWLAALTAIHVVLQIAAAATAFAWSMRWLGSALRRLRKSTDGAEPG